MTTTNINSNFLTEYEKERNVRVMRNELLMRRLGLSDFDSYMHNSSSKKGNKREEEDEDDSSDEKKKKEKKRRKRETDVEKVVFVRRSSSRLKRGGGKGETDEQQQEEDKDIKEDKEEEFKERDEEQERKHRIAEQEFSYRNKMKQKKQTIVGTASYQHTLMRVRTMTEPKLRNRMHAISRAKGQHCVTKMRLFARILFLEGYEELAEECARMTRVFENASLAYFLARELKICDFNNMADRGEYYTSLLECVLVFHETLVPTLKEKLRAAFEKYDNMRDIVQQAKTFLHVTEAANAVEEDKYEEREQEEVVLENLAKLIVRVGTAIEANAIVDLTKDDDAMTTKSR